MHITELHPDLQGVPPVPRTWGEYANLLRPYLHDVPRVVADSWSNEPKFVRSPYAVCVHTTVKAPMRVFKAAETKTGVSLIVSLIVPVGARVYYELDRVPTWHSPIGASDRKMRCSKALVESIFDPMTRRGRKSAYSWYGVPAGKFYFPGKTVKPVGREFSMANEQCAPGIHFFMLLRDAVWWVW